ncbi:MAG: hypothetical protein ACI4SG_00500 [Oligosphaeraceae bacterium]
MRISLSFLSSWRNRILLELLVWLCLSAVGYGVWRWQMRQILLKPRLVSTARIEGGAWESGMARIRVELPFNTSTELHYVVPLEAGTDRPRASASRVLFWAPFLGAAPAIRARGLPAAALEYARRSGWTVFTLSIDSPAPGDCGEHPYYTRNASGWWRVVFAAKAWLEEQYGLTPGKLLLGGESAGGGMAQHMAVAFPERILAAAWSGGSGYDPIPPQCPVPLFALNSWGCYGATPSWELRRQAASSGNQLLWEEVPPYLEGQKVEHHAPSRTTEEWKWRFLQAIVDLQDPVTGEIPPREQWPEHMEMPDGTTVHFPCAALKSAWEELPLEVNHALRQGPMDKILRGAVPLPRKMDAFFFYQEAGDSFLQDAAERLYRHGAQARFFVCPTGTPDGEMSQDDAAREEARLEEAWRALRQDGDSPLPLLLLGNAEGARLALQMAGRLCREDSGVTRPLYLALLDPLLSLDEEEQLRQLPCPRRVFMGEEEISPLGEEETVWLSLAENPEILWLDFVRGAARFPEVP